MPDYIPLQYDPVAESYLQWQYNKEVSTQDLIVQYREYYDGDHDTELSDRLAEFLELKAGQEFNINYCPVVVDALAERLVVTGFEAGEQGATFWNWWQANRMDAEQSITHLAAVRDGDAFVLVEWDNDAKRPRFTFEPACAEQVGVKVHYSHEDRKKIAMASKRWKVELGENAGTVRRINLYFPDHIEKYISRNTVYEGNWQPLEEDGGIIRDGLFGPAGWHWWTDNQRQDGKPLGVPIAHAKNRDQGYQNGQSELKDVLPIQNALNKAMIDLIAAADTAGFPILVGAGDSWQNLSIGPGAIVSSTKSATEVSLTKIAAEDMRPLIAVKDSFAVDIARVTRTPLSYFQISGQMPAEGAEKQRESGLVARAKNRQVVFGNAWEDVMAIGRRLHNAFGDGPSMDESQSITSVWQDVETRNEFEHMQTLVLKRQAGVPQEQIWREMGYNDEQIASFKRAEIREASLAARRQIGGPNGAGTEGQTNGRAGQEEGERPPANGRGRPALVGGDA